MSEVAGKAREGWAVRKVPHLDMWPERVYKNWIAYHCAYVNGYAQYEFQWFASWREAYAYAYVGAYGTMAALSMFKDFVDHDNRVSPTYLDTLGVGT